uniref:Uncharacterized protein n=1 Tax=Rhizophora mucronata TaxID=61149 RepID=A0A2P2PD85_RHIMU
MLLLLEGILYARTIRD